MAVPESWPLGPAAAKRQLAWQLRQLRAGRGVQGDAVARSLRWSASKLSRYERGQTTLHMGEVSSLLTYYGITGQRRAQLMALATEASERGWWEGRAELTPAGQERIGLEQGASVIRVWQQGIIPPLLQTAEYARHVLRGWAAMQAMAPAAMTRVAETVTLRQAILDGEPPARLMAVIDAAALEIPAGPPEVMRGQLQRLAEDTRPNVTVQILPSTVPRPVHPDSFTLLRFGPDDTDIPPIPDIVIRDHLAGGCSDGDENTAWLHRVAFGKLARAALSPEESRAAAAALA